MHRLHTARRSRYLLLVTAATVSFEDDRLHETAIGFRLVALDAAEWPLFVGRSWVSAYRVLYESNQSFDVRMSHKVEAYEDVTVLAGTFKVFRVSSDDGGPYNSVTWWNPETGLAVKTTAENTFKHFRGPGSRESQLISYELKK